MNRLFRRIGRIFGATVNLFLTYSGKDGSLPWVRFHALPDSKRYAENEQEKAIVLEEAYALGDALLGSETECWQIECVYKDDDEVLKHDPNARFTSENTSWLLKVSKTRRPRKEHDELLVKIAEDGTGPTMWMRCTDGAIFAPYDGGFDLSLSDKQMAENLKDSFRDWLSTHPEGL